MFINRHPYFYPLSNVYFFHQAATFNLHLDSKIANVNVCNSWTKRKKIDGSEALYHLRTFADQKCITNLQIRTINYVLDSNLLLFWLWALFYCIRDSIWYWFEVICSCLFSFVYGILLQARDLMGKNLARVQIIHA